MHAHSPASIRLMMALTPKRLFLPFSRKKRANNWSTHWVRCTSDSWKNRRATGCCVYAWKRNELFRDANGANRKWQSKWRQKKRKCFSKSSIWKEKTVKWQRLSRADLNRRPLAEEAHSLNNLRSIRLGYLWVYECRWKKIDQTIFGDRHRQPVPVLRLQAFATHWDEAFVSRFSSRATVVSELILPGIRLLFPSASKIPAWLFSSPYWPRLRCSQYVDSENNRRYFLSLEKYRLYISYTAASVRKQNAKKVRESTTVRAVRKFHAYKRSEAFSAQKFSACEKYTLFKTKLYEKLQYVFVLCVCL